MSFLDDQNNPPAGGPSDQNQSTPHTQDQPTPVSSDTGQAPEPSADAPSQPEQPQTTGGTCTDCGGPTDTSGNCPNCNPAPAPEPSGTGQAGQ